MTIKRKGFVPTHLRRVSLYLPDVTGRVFWLHQGSSLRRGEAAVAVGGFWRAGLGWFPLQSVPEKWHCPT